VRINPTLFNRIVRPLAFILLLLPLLNLLFGLYSNTLGANPIEYALRFFGEWSLRILLIALLISPLSRLLSWVQLLQLRRMLGLYAFFYASLHLLCYLIFEQALDINAIFADIWERPFITVGFAAFLTLLPLAITSTRTKIRQMGKRWKLLHQLVYLAVILCVVHFWWLVKADVSEPLVYASLTTIVLFERVWHWGKNKNRP